MDHIAITEIKGNYYQGVWNKYNIQSDNYRGIHIIANELQNM